jgi:hypothetical protein
MLIEQGEVFDSIKAWYKDKSIFEKVFLEPDKNRLCVQIFQYVPKSAASGLIGLSGENLSKKQHSKILPIARVVTSGVEEYKPDDILKIPDYSLNVQVNPEYDKAKKYNDARPDVKEHVPMPAQYIMPGVEEWVANNRYDIYSIVGAPPIKDYSPYDYLVFVLAKSSFEGKMDALKKMLE